MNVGADGHFEAVERLLPALAKVKEEAFSGEDEWRLFVVGQTAKVDLFYATNRGVLVPLVALDFKTSYVDEIVVGPGAHQDLRHAGVQRLINSLGLFSITVRNSNVPFRGQ